MSTALTNAKQRHTGNTTLTRLSLLTNIALNVRINAKAFPKIHAYAQKPNKIIFTIHKAKPVIATSKAGVVEEVCEIHSGHSSSLCHGWSGVPGYDPLLP